MCEDGPKLKGEGPKPAGAPTPAGGRGDADRPPRPSTLTALGATWMDGVGSGSGTGRLRAASGKDGGCWEVGALPARCALCLRGLRFACNHSRSSRQRVLW